MPLPDLSSVHHHVYLYCASDHLQQSSLVWVPKGCKKGAYSTLRIEGLQWTTDPFTLTCPTVALSITTGSRSSLGCLTSVDWCCPEVHTILTVTEKERRNEQWHFGNAWNVPTVLSTPMPQLSLSCVLHVPRIGRSGPAATGSHDISPGLGMFAFDS